MTTITAITDTTLILSASDSEYTDSRLSINQVLFDARPLELLTKLQLIC